MSADDIKKDLRSLSGFLESWGYVANASLLYSIQFKEDLANGYIEYGLSKSEPLRFINIDIERHSIPQGIERIPNDEIDIEVQLETVCCQIKDPNINEDPFIKLGVNILINGEYYKDDQINNLFCAYHLDKNINGGKDGYSHPEYHINFGGQHMCKRGDVYGELFLMPSPRLLHPPMDIILSCDFIIRNLYSMRKQKKLIDHPGYISLLKKVKEKYWQPFGKAFNSNWLSDTEIINLNHKMISY